MLARKIRGPVRIHVKGHKEVDNHVLYIPSAASSMGERDPSPLTEALIETLRITLGDPSMSLLRWSAELGSYVDGEGDPAHLPADAHGRSIAVLERDGRRLGALLFLPALNSQAELLTAVERVTATALDEEQRRYDLDQEIDATRQSRQRIQLGSDDLCRRFESGLHDGAQQPLVAVQLLLQQVLRAGSETERLDLVKRASSHLHGVLQELRDLALVVPPPVLRERGLSAALTSLAERSGLPVELSIDLARRLPTATEMAAYLVAAEGVANAEHHAAATHVAIAARSSHGHLRVVVSDDGRGGANITENGRLGLLIDRAAALDGTLMVVSQEGAGTVLTLDLPESTS